jgi:YHS domain-containing protein
MLTRLLLWLLLLMLVFRAIGRVIGGIVDGAAGTPPPKRSGGRSSSTTPVKGELMARDPVCGTFVVQSRAVSARGRDGLQYFCSEKCRDAYLKS